MTRPRNILVIDDTPEIPDLVCAAAESAKMNCTSTTTVDHFLSALTAEIDLILMDMKMPEMNGRELMAMLGANHCAAKIVLMSGSGRGALVEAELYGRSLGLHMGGTLLKPFRVAELIAILKQ